MENNSLEVSDSCEKNKVLQEICASIDFGRLTEDCKNAIYNHFKNSEATGLENMRIYTPSTLLYGKQVRCNAERVVFGNKSSKPNDILCGKFAIVHGLFMLVDANASKQMYIKTDKKSTLLDLVNKLVILEKFQILSEMYIDGSLSCIFVNASDIQNLNYTFEPVNNIQLSLDANIQHKFTTKILITHISSPILLPSTNKFIIYIAWEAKKTKQILRLSEYYLNTVAFLEVGSTYLMKYSNEMRNLHLDSEVYENMKLPGFMYMQEDLYFILHTFNRIEPLETLQSAPGLHTIRAKVQSHFLNTDQNARPYKRINKDGIFVGTLPHNIDHRLVIEFENGSSSLYFNKFRFKPAPIGAVPGVELIIYNVLRSGSYYKSTIMTHIAVDGITSPLDSFTTANLFEEPESFQDYETLENVDQLMVNYWTILRLRLKVKKIYVDLNTYHHTFKMQVFVQVNNVERKLVSNDFQIFVRVIFPSAMNWQVMEAGCSYIKTVHLDDLESIENDRDLDILHIQKWLFMEWRAIFMRIRMVDVVCLRDLSEEYKILKLINFESQPT